MIVMFATLCLLSGPACQAVEFKDNFEDMETCDEFAARATASLASIPREPRQYLTIREIGCREEKDI